MTDKNFTSTRRSLFIVTACAYLFFDAPHALAAAGVVHLKNGGWIDGDVMEVVPDQHVTIRLRDDSVREIAWDQVDHVEKTVAAPPSAAPARPAYERPPARWQRPESSESWRDRDAADRPRRRARRDAAARLPTLAFLGQLTVGGGAHVEAVQGSDSESANVSLLPGYGGGAELSVPVGRFFALGGIVSYSRLKTETGSESVGFLDGAFVPRLQYAFGGDPLVLRAFFEVQIGIGWADLPKPSTTLITSVTPVFDIGPSGGLELFVSSRVGLLLKFGWLYRLFGFDVLAGNGRRESATLEYQTLVLQLGVTIAVGSSDE